MSRHDSKYYGDYSFCSGIFCASSGICWGYIAVPIIQMEKNSAHLAETEFRGLGSRRSGYNSPVVWSLALGGVYGYRFGV